MMTRTLFITMGALAAGLAAIAEQGPVPMDSPRVVNMDQLRGPDWETREANFYRIIESSGYAGDPRSVTRAMSALTATRPGKSAELSATMTALLGVENAYLASHKKIFAATGQTLSEEYTAYYGDVIEATTFFRDPRSLSALFGALNTGNMVLNALAGFGDLALNPALDRLEIETDPVTLHSLVLLLANLSEPPKVGRLSGAAARARLKEWLVRATEDPDRCVRLSAVDGLGSLGDESTAPVLERIARSDAYASGGSSGEPQRFPVRDAALKALAKIQRNRSCVVTA